LTDRVIFSTNEKHVQIFRNCACCGNSIFIVNAAADIHYAELGSNLNGGNSANGLLKVRSRSAESLTSPVNFANKKFADRLGARLPCGESMFISLIKNNNRLAVRVRWELTRL
jgi:hypothetical protein